MANKCGAKTRAGGRCRANGMANGRCRVHGGPSTGPKTPNTAQNARTHGIYARHLTDEEQAQYPSVTAGSVEHELKIARFQLARTLAAQAAAAGKPELEEITSHKVVGPGSRKDILSKVRDYPGIINMQLARIESLEKTLLALRIEQPPDPSSLDADKLTPGTPDETPPAKPIR